MTGRDSLRTINNSNEKSIVRSDTRLHSRVPAVLFLTLGFIGSILASSQRPFWPTLESLLIPSIILCVTAVLGFFVSGGRTMNASSAASFGVLIFGGFPGVYSALGLNGSADSSLSSALLAAIVLLFAFQLLLIGNQYRLGLNHVQPKHANAKPDSSPARAILALGTFSTGLLAALAGINIVGAPLAILGIFLTADFFYQKRRFGPTTLGCIIILIMTWIYWEHIFHGFGRLVIAVIATGVISIVSFHFRHSGIKISLLIGASVALPILAAARLDFLEESRGSTPSDSEGIGSVVGPIIAFARVIQASWSSLLHPSWGSTYFDAITLWIPRELWPAKPQGFGAEMVPITKPYQVSSSGFSDAALFGGELVWNFGVVGSFCVLPIIVLILSILDRQLLSDSFAENDPAGFIYRVLIIALSASVLNFIWAGSNLYVGRLQIMLACLLLMWLSTRFGARIAMTNANRHPSLSG